MSKFKDFIIFLITNNHLDIITCQRVIRKEIVRYLK
jgi:hypothetical protein